MRLGKRERAALVLRNASAAAARGRSGFADMRGFVPSILLQEIKTSLTNVWPMGKPTVHPFWTSTEARKMGQRKAISNL
jgi:hypothetical protein